MTVGERPADLIAAEAARLIADDGLEYGAAKAKAARSLFGAGRRVQMPSNEEVEAALREQLALFHADTQPAELQALRELALQWMLRLAALRPHLGGAVWRGTATRHSAIHIDMYCDDPKEAAITLLNLGIAHDVNSAPGGPRGEDLEVLSLLARTPAWPEPVALHLSVHDHDQLRGALKPDARGRTWRGDVAALQHLLRELEDE